MRRGRSIRGRHLARVRARKEESDGTKVKEPQQLDKHMRLCQLQQRSKDKNRDIAAAEVEITAGAGCG
jgi:hypothetical protein